MKHHSAVLLVNLDIPEKELKSSLRLRRAAESVNSAAKRFKKIVVIAHRGRPVGLDKKLSLRRIAAALSATSGRNINFISSIDKKTIVEKTSADGIHMLENIRFFPGEAENSPVLSRFLASLGDIFINDDFATAHRKSASNVGILKYIPGMPGPILSAEIKNLSRLIRNPKRPFVVVIGGAKTEDKLDVIKRLIPLADKILLGGGPGNAALAADGYDIGDSIGGIKSASSLKRLMKSGKIIYPVDFRVQEKRILDIGPNTENIYTEKIAAAKTVVWAGPMGLFEKVKFSRGSEAVAKSIVASGGFSVAGGGETSAVIMNLGLEDKFSFVSTGGGAMLDFLSGKKLPAVEALKLKI